MRVCGGSAQRLWTDAGFGQEQAQPFGSSGNEGKRLNGNDFSHFARVLCSLFHRPDLPFRNFSLLLCGHGA
jgi:hypothetical protein